MTRNCRRHCVTRALTALLLTLTLQVNAEPAPGSIDSDPVRCQELAELVADRCPKGCTQRHCNTRCIPPFSETDRCARCQELCFRICDGMYETQSAMCRGEREADHF